MSYELLALPVPPGGDLEECAEALVVRLAGGHQRPDTSADGLARRDEIAAVARAADPALQPPSDGPDATLVVADGAGFRADVGPRFARVSVAYSTDAEEAEALFGRLFAVLGAIVAATGWAVYDPQEAGGIGVDEESRDATLEIYLSVVDQLGAA